MTASPFTIRPIGTVSFSVRPDIDLSERTRLIIVAAAAGRPLNDFYTEDLGRALNLMSEIAPISELHTSQIDRVIELANEIVGRDDDYIVGGDTLALAKIVTVNHALGGNIETVDYLNDVYLCGDADLNDIIEMMELDASITHTPKPLDEPAERLFGSVPITFSVDDFMRLCIDNDGDVQEFLYEMEIYERSFRAVLGDAWVDEKLVDVLKSWDTTDFDGYWAEDWKLWNDHKAI
jgi:hypothetical protein